MIKRIVCAVAILLFTQSFLFGVEPLFSKPNEKVRNFKVADLTGNHVSLSDFNNGRVLLFFWTTWCPYCRDELKQLNAQASQLEKDGLAVLPINVGESKSKVENFLKSRNLTLRVFLDEDSSVSQGFDLLGVPTYILIDTQGIIRSKEHSFPQKKIKELR